LPHFPGGEEKQVPHPRFSRVRNDKSSGLRNSEVQERV
jgi:hypothetical protein